MICHSRQDCDPRVLASRLSGIKWPFRVPNLICRACAKPVNVAADAIMPLNACSRRVSVVFLASVTWVLDDNSESSLWVCAARNVSNVASVICALHSPSPCGESWNFGWEIFAVGTAWAETFARDS
jgi:hypothetical protein